MVWWLLHDQWNCKNTTGHKWHDAHMLSWRYRVKCFEPSNRSSSRGMVPGWKCCGVWARCDFWALYTGGLGPGWHAKMIASTRPEFLAINAVLVNCHEGTVLCFISRKNYRCPLPLLISFLQSVASEAAAKSLDKDHEEWVIPPFQVSEAWYDMMA